MTSLLIDSISERDLGHIGEILSSILFGRFWSLRPKTVFQEQCSQNGNRGQIKLCVRVIVNQKNAVPWRDASLQQESENGKHTCTHLPQHTINSSISLTKPSVSVVLLVSFYASRSRTSMLVRHYQHKLILAIIGSWEVEFHLSQIQPQIGDRNLCPAHWTYLLFPYDQIFSIPH